jgi:hypothetical protein
VSVVLVLFVALGTGFIIGFSILYLLYCIYSLFFLMNGRVLPFIKKISSLLLEARWIESAGLVLFFLDAKGEHCLVGSTSNRKGC